VINGARRGDDRIELCPCEIALKPCEDGLHRVVLAGLRRTGQNETNSIYVIELIPIK
jgi:hypothetical protein